MDWITKLGLVIAVLGVAIGVVTFFAPYEWRDMTPLWRRLGLSLGFGFALLSIALLVLLPVQEPPEIGLRFVGKPDTLLQVVNESKTVAKDIKWTIMAWNINRVDPLPIPTTTLDFLIPGSGTLPINVFQTPLTRQLIESGDQVIGSASVNCPECSRANTYIFKIEWGKGGWFYRLPNMTNGNTLTPIGPDRVRDYANELVRMAPVTQRMQIEDLKQIPIDPPDALPHAQATPTSPAETQYRGSPDSAYLRLRPWSL
jgi:hypothetical protein